MQKDKNNGSGRITAIQVIDDYGMMVSRRVRQPVGERRVQLSGMECLPA